MPKETKRDRTQPTVTRQEALDFHSQGRPGKLEVTPTKPMATQRDLSLAYPRGRRAGQGHRRRSGHRL